MNVLHIRLFGGFKLIHPLHQTEHVNLTQSLKALLAYLLLHRHRCYPREMLFTVFWGESDDERARSCLNTALWRLRRVLEPESVPKGSYLVTNADGEVGFNSESDHWLDVAVFEENARKILSKPVDRIESSDAMELEHAFSLYTGELLEGFYDEWVLRERERLHSLYLESLAHLMHYHRHRADLDKSLASAREILIREPLREEIHREMMRMYLQGGRRAMAVQQYRTCSRILKSELGISPMEETRALYLEALDSRAKGSREPSIPSRSVPDSEWDDGHPTLARAVQELREAAIKLREAEERFRQAIVLLEKISGSQMDEDREDERPEQPADRSPMN